MQTGSRVVSDRLTCTNTATKKINQSLRWATEIHIMWLLSYSTLITPYPCHQSEERRSSCVYRRSGERGEGKLLPTAFKYGCVSMCMDHYRLCDCIYDHFFFFLQNQNYNHSTSRQIQQLPQFWCLLLRSVKLTTFMIMILTFF